jgi:hypothetical protein
MSQLLGRSLRRPLALVVALLSLALVVGSPGTAGAAVRTPSHTVAKNDKGVMKSYVYGHTGNGRRVVGSFTPTKFVVGPAGNLRAIGKLNIVTRGPGKDVHRVANNVSMRVKRFSAAGTFPSGGAATPSSATGTCSILHLVLGPLDLNLLGLHVHLNRVVLDITAIPGAGNLLGNLLCAVAGLLDGSALGPIATALQNLLAALKL